MSSFAQQYQNKKKTLEEAYNYLRDGDIIAAANSANEPFEFLSHLSSQKGKLKNLELFMSLSLGEYDFMEVDGDYDFLTIYTWFLMPPARKSRKRLEYIPGHLHNCTTRQNHVKQATVFVVCVTPMDEHGYFRYSLTNMGEKIWKDNAQRIILEVNPNMPVVYGDNEIHISQVDCLYEVDYSIPTLEKKEPSEIDKAIGEHVASLVNDGDTIQLGIGAIPDAVAQAFMKKRDLGVHTEMITSSIADLVEAGVVNGSKKTLHPGKIVATFALGNKKLYDFLNHNPSVMIMPGYYVNDPSLISQNDNMVSINTSLGVDFAGQVCSESIGPRQYSGSGGQNDTASGAIHAKNGRSIIALKSTTKGGTISTIQPTLLPGSVVTLSRNNVDYIVTEYGVAFLKNKSLRERTLELIRIAHPKFRDELAQKAVEMGNITEQDARGLAAATTGML